MHNKHFVVGVFFKKKIFVIIDLSGVKDLNKTDGGIHSLMLSSVYQLNLKRFQNVYKYPVASAIDRIFQFSLISMRLKEKDIIESGSYKVTVSADQTGIKISKRKIYIIPLHLIYKKRTHNHFCCNTNSYCAINFFLRNISPKIPFLTVFRRFFRNAQIYLTGPVCRWLSTSRQISHCKFQDAVFL